MGGGSGIATWRFLGEVGAKPRLELVRRKMEERKIDDSE